MIHRLAMSMAAIVASAATATASEIRVVVPGAYEHVEGPDAVNLPDLDSYRFQVIMDASEFEELGDTTWFLTDHRLRTDAGAAPGTTTTQSLFEVRASVTSVEPNHMSTVFAENIETEPIVVYTGGPETLTTGEPMGFDMGATWQTPFPYNPRDGNLLLDFWVEGQNGPVAADFVKPRTPTVGWMWTGLSGNMHSPSSDGQFYTGDVWQFTFIPEPSSFVLAAIGALTLVAAACWRRGKRAA